MRSILRIALVAVALAAHPMPGAAAAQIPCAHADLTPTVISGNDLTRAGAIRLSDILRSIPDWHTTSTDGYLWSATPGIAALPQWNSWQLMVDGQPLSITLLGESYLNAYPVDVGLVDSVEVFEGPVTCYGVYAASGLIHIHTRQEKEYYAVGGSIALQNETGDPGPYRYTELTSGNVDRSGPVGSVFGAISQKRWHFRGSTMFDEHHVTDPSLWPRVRKLFTTLIPPRQEMEGWRFDVRTALEDAAVSATYESSHLEHFRYLPSAGREIPLAYSLDRFGASGHFRFSPLAELFFAGEHAEVELDHYRTMEELDVDWRERRSQGNAGVRIQVPTGSVTTGFSVENLRAGRRATAIRTGAWFASAESSPRPDVRLTAWLRAVIEDQQQSLKGGVGGDWEFVPGHRLQFSGSLTDLPVRHTQNLAYWLDHGLVTPEIPALDIGVSPDPRPAHRLTASAGWRWTLKPYVESTATATLAHFTSAQHFVHDLHLAIEDSVPWVYNRYFEGDAALLRWLSGTMYRLAMDASVRPIHGLTARLHYAYTYPRSTMPGFHRAWSTIPEHRAHGTLTFAPVDRISVLLRIRYESWTTWPDYARVAAPSDFVYPERMPVLALVDFAVRKRFWYDHMYISMLLTNILSRHVQLHPAGAANDLTLMARVHLQF